MEGGITLQTVTLGDHVRASDPIFPKGFSSSLSVNDFLGLGMEKIRD